MNSTKSLWFAVIVVAIIAVGGYFFPHTQLLGSTGTRYPNGLSADSTSPVAGQVRGSALYTTGSLTVGSTGTAIKGAWSGECYWFQASAPNAPTIIASTTVVADCQATNPLTSATPSQSALDVPAWRAGDAVFVGPVASSTVLGQGLQVTAVGSSTAGYITLRYTNETGASFAPATTTGVKLQYLYVRRN